MITTPMRPPDGDVLGVIQLINAKAGGDPLRDQDFDTRVKTFTAGDERLCAALAMIIGSESMIVFRDVMRVDEKTAREVKSWAVRALVRAALQESE